MSQAPINTGLFRGKSKAFADMDSHWSTDGSTDKQEKKEEKEEKQEEREEEKPKDDRFYYTWDKLRKKLSASGERSIPELDEKFGGQHRREQRNSDGMSVHENAAASFEDAAANCRSKVRAIAAECRRLNKKYFDPEFDLDLKSSLLSLKTIVKGETYFGDVVGVRRVSEIFEKPQLFIDKAKLYDDVQGLIGNCWFVAAVASVAGKSECLERLCVEYDQDVGVYGFCFHRDGQWIWSIVDDTLCLQRHEGQHHYLVTLKKDEEKRSHDLAEEARRLVFKGSDALFFGKCRNANETWFPLLEKAYAKAHLSYRSLVAGHVSEGIEDLTGGVTMKMYAKDIVDSGRFWDELQQANKNFLFGCASRNPYYKNKKLEDDKGVPLCHTFTVLSVRTVTRKADKDDKSDKNDNMEETVRLVQVRNPWGEGKWTGAWSDGSKDWTPETLKQLDYTFGDNGIFWMSLDDFLKVFETLDRTRLFDASWTVSQQWTSVRVPKAMTSSDTLDLPQIFRVRLTKTSQVVIVLSTPNHRYFKALRGRFKMSLRFALYKDGQETFIARSAAGPGVFVHTRHKSVAAELELQPGDYTVKVNVVADKFGDHTTAAQILKDYRKYGQQIVLREAHLFDLVHSHGRPREAEMEETKRIKEEARETECKGLKAIRNLQQERRRRGKLAKRRIAKRQRYLAKRREKRSQAKDKVTPDGPCEKDETPDDAGPETSSLTEATAALDLGCNDGCEPDVHGKRDEAAEESDDPISDYGSVEDADFSWDSEMDGPIDGEDFSVESENSDDELEEKDPWFAVATIGLRVYSQDPDMSVRMEHVSDKASR